MESIWMVRLLLWIGMLLMLGLCGRLQVALGHDLVKIWVKNWLVMPVELKVNDGKGIVIEHWTPISRKQTVFTVGNAANKSLLLAQTPEGYRRQRPWFMWIGIDTYSSNSSAYAFDPFAQSTQTAGCIWELYGDGIFYTRTDSTGKTKASDRPTCFCTWNQEAQHFQPSNYDSHQPLHSCSAYSASWSLIPVWISLCNSLQTDVKVTLSKGNEASIQLDVSKMENGLAGYTNAVMSRSYEEYRSHGWTAVVHVQQDPLRNFDVTLKDTVRSETAAQAIGSIFRFKNQTILVVRVNAAWEKGQSKKLCVWHKQDATDLVPYCGGIGN